MYHLERSRCRTECAGRLTDDGDEIENCSELESSPVGRPVASLAELHRESDTPRGRAQLAVSLESDIAHRSVGNAWVYMCFLIARCQSSLCF